MITRPQLVHAHRRRGHQHDHVAERTQDHPPAAEAMTHRVADPERGVERLAEIAGMSLSSFHQHFRAITSLSPLQFRKQLRLIEGRLEAHGASGPEGCEAPGKR